MKKAVIFDLDGTLIDSLEDIAINANKVLRELNCPTHSLEQYKYFVGDGAKVLIENAMPKYISQNCLDDALMSPIQTITAIFTPKLCCHFL